MVALDVETVIFDDELSPGQLRNLERQLGAAKGGGEGSVRVCDRTALILDIFLQRARTREGQLQVGACGWRRALVRSRRCYSYMRCKTSEKKAAPGKGLMPLLPP